MMCDFKFLSFCVSFCFLTYKMGRVIHLLLEDMNGKWSYKKWILHTVPGTQEPFFVNVCFLPFNFPEKSRVVFLGTVCLVTGYKQLYFLGSDSMLIEDSKERKTEEFVSSLVTKVTFQKESHQWIVHIAWVCLSSSISFELATSKREPTYQGGLLLIKELPVRMAAATVIEGWI